MAISFFIIVLIITLLAFAITVPINGFLTSWLITHGSYDKRHAHAEQVESIFDYFDFFGSICLIFIGFGWGTIMPVDQDYITGAYRKTRIFFAYSAQSLVSIFLALCAIIPSVLLTSRACIYTSLNIFLANLLKNPNSDSTLYAFQQGASTFGKFSPYAITGTLFLMGVVYIQVILLCVSMVRNTFQAAIHPFRYQLLTHQYSWFLMLAISIAFCLFFYQFFIAFALGLIVSLIELVNFLIGT